MVLNRRPQARDTVIRQPRLRDVRPTVAETAPTRRPHRVFSSPYILLFSFVMLIVTGGLLLTTPVASSAGSFTPLDMAFFTAISAITVTGLTVVDTGAYWSAFGQAVIFFLMLVGGLGFMAVATFLLILIGQRSSLQERLVMRDTMGTDRMGGLRRVTISILGVVLFIYILGAAAIFWRINGLAEMGVGESIWQSTFLAVSAFNNAGFSILPESVGPGLTGLDAEWAFLGFMTILIILGGIGWTVLLDVFRHRRFARLNLDTKLVLVTSVGLWVLGAGTFFLAEYSETLAGFGTADKAVSSVFHSISGRTAGFAAVDFALVDDFTKVTFPALMFIGGAAGSVAGGIKVATFAVIIAAVISSVRGRSEAEAFGREIAHFQVLRALTVVALGVGFLMVVLPTLTVTDPDIPFLDLFFDTVSAFGTNGTTTGIVPGLSLPGKCIFMITMFVGRLGPLTLALALAPREEASVYRFARERVKIG